jgi:hypothetical protein
MKISPNIQTEGKTIEIKSSDLNSDSCETQRNVHKYTLMANSHSGPRGPNNAPHRPLTPLQASAQADSPLSSSPHSHAQPDPANDPSESDLAAPEARGSDAPFEIVAPVPTGLADAERAAAAGPAVGVPDLSPDRPRAPAGSNKRSPPTPTPAPSLLSAPSSVGSELSDEDDKVGMRVCVVDSSCGGVCMCMWLEFPSRRIIHPLTFLLQVLFYLSVRSDAGEFSQIGGPFLCLCLCLCLPCSIFILFICISFNCSSSNDVCVLACAPRGYAGAVKLPVRVSALSADP